MVRGTNNAKGHFLLLLIAVCLVVFFLSQSFHSLLPHNNKGKDHHVTIVHGHMHDQKLGIGRAGLAHIHAHHSPDDAYRGHPFGRPHRTVPESSTAVPAERLPQEVATADHLPQAGRHDVQLDDEEEEDVVVERPVVRLADRSQYKTDRSSAFKTVSDSKQSTKMWSSESIEHDTEVPESKPQVRAPVKKNEAAHTADVADCWSDEDCGGHGGCREGKCVCVVFYTGDHCERPIDLPPSMQRSPFQNFKPSFDGSMILNQKKVRTRKAITVHLPGKEKDPDHGFRTLADGKVLADLLPLLPEEDIMTSNFYETCAIVGSSGILLNYEDGAEIDEHDMVFRFNSAPTKGYEKHVGKKTTFRITNTQNWGFHESEKENLVIHFRAASSVKGLFWNGHQKTPWRLYAFDPDVVEYIAFGLDFMATSGLYGILLAMHRCARVDLYGFQVSTEHGTLYHYYDVCDIPANMDRDSSEYIAVKALAEAGLVHFAEPCIIECHVSATECAQCKKATHFKHVVLPSDSKCDPNRKSVGHQEVPWRAERRRHRRP
eukprot:5519285-Pyramimonas_sp.AAC.1